MQHISSDPTEIRAEIDDLLALIARSPTRRPAAQPRLHRLLTALKAAGAPVPLDLLALDQKLVDEAVEDMFDNLPV
ncbi:hypothetical protein EU803_04395 [Loktanella sp. IMCC34160]|uniref:hypothetical protein n=1 Tax=Loktanella sp. IMCC34160 TaxID=2510646 RepID=UPI00101C8420|nr:hypothetical protein [Loktanella sp. IMCC34160]RYG91708.1 hypothetical protein EU803_04395 [Loktanella sp. IMCC34160]